MFNGLIREIAHVVSLSANILRIKSSLRPRLGDSIAINGVCLSTVALHNDGFSVELSTQTRKIVATENFNARVHVEPAMRLGERMDGHLVQGHIDAVGEIYKISKDENMTSFFVRVPAKILPLLCAQGSVAVDGVSLTIAEVGADGFRLAVIPVTMRDTLFGEYRVGRRVNIETDLFARYAARILWFASLAGADGARGGKSASVGGAHDGEISWDDVDKIMAIY